MAKKSNKAWFRTDEIQDFISTLEFCAYLAGELKNNPSHWKWLIITLHNALQAACVCALKGWCTSGVTVLSKKAANKMWYWLNVESRENPNAPMPREILAFLTDLYDCVRDSEFPTPHRLPADSLRDKDVFRLNSLRSDFIHFKPGSYSLELEGMPRIVKNCCGVIEHLAVKHPTFWHHLDDKKRKQIEGALIKIRKNISGFE